MTGWITGIGHARPGRPLPQADVIAWLLKRLAPGINPERLQRFAEHAGVGHRHAAIDLLGEDGDAISPSGRAHADTLVCSRAFVRLAAALAIAAAKRRLPRWGRGDIPSHRGNQHGADAPGLDLQLIEQLDLPRTVRWTIIGFMGCNAAPPAVRQAADAMRADPSARVLVVCCERSSLQVQTGPDDGALVAASRFGDGAAAAIVEGTPAGVRLRVVRDACVVVPPSADAMAWIAASDAFRLSLAPTIAAALGTVLPELTQRVVGDTRRDAVDRPSGRPVHPGCGRTGPGAAGWLPPDQPRGLAHCRLSLQRHGPGHPGRPLRQRLVLRPRAARESS